MLGTAGRIRSSADSGVRLLAGDESIAPSGITGIGVEGFKSLRQPQEIDIAPLTVLAGVNSSGKSSIIQPLLLLKQTLEVPYDPGPLLLDGPNVSVTRMEQILSRGSRATANSEFFAVKVQTNDYPYARLRFGKEGSKGIRLLDVTAQLAGRPVTFSEGMSGRLLRDELAGSALEHLAQDLIHQWATSGAPEPGLTITRDRWSLDVDVDLAERIGSGTATISINLGLAGIEREVARIIHLPALRGNPKRTYRTAAVEEHFPGVFNDYTAGIISAWQDRQDQSKLSQLGSDLERLGLSWTVVSRQLDDTSVELLVGRLPHGKPSGTQDLVNIADVGFGVSQTLPVLVALLTAAPGQLVYLEQPEIHLHPRAQTEFAYLLAAAVNRGVRVVVETHSSLLLRAVQTLVAQRNIAISDVVLHWFSRDIKTGYTSIASAKLDRQGSFGDWPEDFDEVNLGAEHAYLTAAEIAEESTE